MYRLIFGVVSIINGLINELESHRSRKEEKKSGIELLLAAAPYVSVILDDY